MLCQAGLAQADFRLYNPLTLHLPSSGMTGMFHTLFLILPVLFILESTRLILMVKVAKEIATLYNLPDIVGSPVTLASTRVSLSFSHHQNSEGSGHSVMLLCLAGSSAAESHWFLFLHCYL